MGFHEWNLLLSGDRGSGKLYIRVFTGENASNIILKHSPFNINLVECLVFHATAAVRKYKVVCLNQEHGCGRRAVFLSRHPFVHLELSTHMH